MAPARPPIWQKLGKVQSTISAQARQGPHNLVFPQASILTDRDGSCDSDCRLCKVFWFYEKVSLHLRVGKGGSNPPSSVKSLHDFRGWKALYSAAEASRGRSHDGVFGKDSRPSTSTTRALTPVPLSPSCTGDAATFSRWRIWRSSTL